VHEAEVHDLGVEPVGRVEVVGGDGDVMERHRGIVGLALFPDTYDLRVVAGERALHEHDVDADPFVTFRHWYDDAVAHGALQPDAMIVATATADARPSARAVILRGVDRGFCFFTNFDSRKGRELHDNPHAAIVLHWPEVLRQVRAAGRVERVTDREADDYWHSRPRASRVSGWASEQSATVESRAALVARADGMVARFGADGDIPRPEFWGGYRVVPDEIEFWQQRDDRLHDRLVYVRSGDGSWSVVRLQP
jgi:pyridoxamine 5'-phosphate oxidase